MTKEDEMLTQAKEAVAEALRRSFFAAGEYSGISADGSRAMAEAIDDLIEVKIAMAIEALNDRIEDGLGMRP